MRTELVEFYNLDNNRPDQKQVDAEIGALLGLEPFVLGICEAIGNQLPIIAGYDRIMDRSTMSRANIAAYVPESAKVRHRWHDLTGTWPRTQGTGRHEPRSILELMIDGVQVPIAHQPPKNARPVEPLQREGILTLVDVMAPWKQPGWAKRRRRAKVRALERPRIGMGDFNRRADEPGPGPMTLATRIGGEVASNRIDTLVVRNVAIKRVRYPDEIPSNRGGRAPVDLRSDHGHALLAHVSW